MIGIDTIRIRIQNIPFYSVIPNLLNSLRSKKNILYLY